MSALHWICALTLALVCCLSAQPVKRNADDDKETAKQMEKQMIFDKLEDFKEFTKNNCPKDTTLYSPTDIRQDCLSSALNCSKNELKVLHESECNVTEDSKELYADIYFDLEYAENETSPSSNSCNSCEFYPQKDAQQFLEDIRSLVQRW